MHSESPALRQEMLVTLGLTLSSDARRPVDRALKQVGRTESADPAVDVIRAAMERPGRNRQTLEIPTSDVEAAAALGDLDAPQRLALVLHHGRHWDPVRIGRALGVPDGAAALAAAELAVPAELRPRLAWEIDHQLRTIEVDGSTSRGRRLAIGLAAGAGAVAAILAFLTLTQATINRPDLIQLRPGGLLRVDDRDEITRLIEEQVTVARVTPDNAVLYQFSGGPGTAGGSIWYSPGPGRRAGQLIPKTGGALGWVETDNLPSGFNPRNRQAVAIVADTIANSGVSTTTHSIVLVDPETKAVAPVIELGTSTGDGESSTAGIKPVFASYGGGRIVVWMMDAVTLESLPATGVESCGEWLLFDLSGNRLMAPGVTPTCDQNTVSASVPTLSSTGTRLMWLETTGQITVDNPPREGWLSAQSTTLQVLDLSNGRRYTTRLTDTNQPTFWTQFTMFSQKTGTLSIDSADDVVVVSIGVWNPQVAVVDYTTYLVDLVGEQVETSYGDGPVTFGH